MGEKITRTDSLLWTWQVRSKATDLARFPTAVLQFAEPRLAASLSTTLVLLPVTVPLHLS